MPNMFWVLCKKLLPNYQQALDLCPEEELPEKASILNNMAQVIAQQGAIARAPFGSNPWKYLSRLVMSMVAALFKG